MFVKVNIYGNQSVVNFLLTEFRSDIERTIELLLHFDGKFIRSYSFLEHVKSCDALQKIN